MAHQHAAPPSRGFFDAMIQDYSPPYEIVHNKVTFTLHLQTEVGTVAVKLTLEEAKQLNANLSLEIGNLIDAYAEAHG